MRQPAPRLNIAQLQRGTRSPAWPEPGFFQLRLVRRGPWVPALIWRPCPMIEPSYLDGADPPEYWCLPTETYPLPIFPDEPGATVWQGLRARKGDDEVDPLDVWIWGERITEAKYDHMMKDRAWARSYSPTDPVAQPRQPVDLSKQPSLF